MTDRFTERPRPVTNKENVTIASSQALTNPHQYIRRGNIITLIKLYRGILTL